MSDASIILQSPQVRDLVQSNALERQFKDSLFPNLLYRHDVEAEEHVGQAGDDVIFTAPGLLPVRAAPLTPGIDPEPVEETYEQWNSVIQPYGSSIDVHMPSSYVALASLFLRKLQQLGLQAGQSLNRKVRDVLHNAAESGWTVADGTCIASTSLRVMNINGFTHARNPSLAGGSQVRFGPVSSANPLNITVYDNATATANTVIGATPDTAGDLWGPGVLTLGTASTSIADRAYVKANDATFMVRVGGGNSIASIGSGDVPTLGDVRTAVARLRGQSVPERPAEGYLVHTGPVSEARLFADAEFQRVAGTSLPEFSIYKDFAIKRFLGCTFLRNPESPTPDNVVGAGLAYSINDPLGVEMYSDGTASGTQVYRLLFVGAGAIGERYVDLMKSTPSEAGLAGKITDGSRMTNDGIEVTAERVKIIMRAPQNRRMDKVSLTWAFDGAWAVRTDAAVGDAARYKRVLCVQHS